MRSSLGARGSHHGGRYAKPTGLLELRAEEEGETAGSPGEGGFRGRKEQVTKEAKRRDAPETAAFIGSLRTRRPGGGWQVNS